MSAAAIRLVVFDLAGTIVDHGCFGPVTAFQASFAEVGVDISESEARGPMGLEKRDHIVALLRNADIAARFRAANGRDWSEADVDRLFQAFQPRQLEAIATHCDLVPGVPALFEELRRRGIATATTTGYFRAAAEPVWAALSGYGVRVDVNLCPEDVPQGRPAPWMIFRAMEATGVYPPSAVVKIGDTAPDVAEGLAAGAHSLAVTRTGSGVGLSCAEFEALPASSQRTRMDQAAAELTAAGAQAVLDDVTALPAWIDARG